MSETTTGTPAVTASNNANAASSSNAASSANSRPIHPAYITNFGPGRGSGSSEFCCYAYLTSPRPRPIRRRHANNISTNEVEEDEEYALPNLVTAQSNSLRVYTILPHAGTLAVSAIYDNLAGTIISLDVIPHGSTSTTTSVVTGGESSKQKSVVTTTNYDGLLLGFAGLPRLSLVYPSTTGSLLVASSIIDFSTTIKEYSYGGLSYSEIDMIVTVLSRSSSQQQQQQQQLYNDNNQDMNIVEDGGDDDDEDDDPPRVSVVLGGGVAIATFSLPRVPRPLEENGRNDDDTTTVENCSSVATTNSSSWWRVASEPYILPLSTLSAKIRDETITTTTSSASNNTNNTEKDKRDTKGNLLSTGVLSSVTTTTTSNTIGHGFGDIIDITYLSGYTEPTLLILHTNPRKGGGRAWSGRLGRTAEIVTTTTTASTPSGSVDEYGDDDMDMDMDSDDDDDDDNDGEERGKEKQHKANTKKVTSYTGTKYGLTLTAISIAMHQRRSVVLWSLVDAMPVDAWKLIPRPTAMRDEGGGGGVLVYGANTIVYISMGGKVQCALAVNGFACIGCPTGLLPPPDVVDTNNNGDNRHVDDGEVGVYLKPNPSPLPCLALQLDASSRISFVTDTIALVCCGNGTLHSLELHHCQSSKLNGIGGRNNEGEYGGMFMSLFPLGYRVGGLGSVTSCLSVFNANHSTCMKRFLGEERVEDVNLDPKVTPKTDEDDSTTNNDDYFKMTVPQLKELLLNKGLKLTGKKDELIERLVESSSSPKVKKDPTSPGNDKERLSSMDSPTLKIQARGLVFVGSRMGDCSLLAFSLNEPTQLVPNDSDNVKDDDDDDDDKDTKNTGSKRKPEAKIMPDALTSIISGGGPMRKYPRRSDAPTIKVDDSDDEKNNGTDHTHENGTGTLTEEDILRLEEEELYRDDDDDHVDGAPTIISSYREDGDSLDDDDDNNDYTSARPDYDGTFMIPRRRHADHRLARHLSMFGSIRALDSLTGLGPLGGGCHGPVATCPSLTGEDDAIVASSASEAQHESLFSNAFSSAARHYIMPCGFGESGGLAVLTTPGRDNVGGSILCESDLCNMAGPVFGLPRSNLVLMGKADGDGSIVLRGILRVDDDQETCVEEFEEVDIGTQVSMNVDGDAPPSFKDAVDILRQMTLLAATEFSSGSNLFSVFFVRDPRLDCINPYAIIVMSHVRQESSSDLGLVIDLVHRINIDESNKAFFNNDNSRGQLTSITPMISKISDDGSSILSVTFGCVWTSGNASVFNINVNNQTTKTKKNESGFKVSESIIVGDNGDNDNYYDSNKVVALDVISLPNHIFDSPTKHTDADHNGVPVKKSSVAAIPELSSSLSFSPDRLSMHGTWNVKLGSLQTPTLSLNRIAVAVCRRSGLLQIFDSEELAASTVVDCQSVTPGTSPIWQANGCSHGTAILGRGGSVRCPEHHEVEVAELRFFITGPSLQPDSISGKMSIIDEEKDSWMLRSLCILVDTSQGDLHLYSGSKRSSNFNRLEFSRVPLANVSRPSDEAGRHLIKLRRRGIVPQQLVKPSFRANRLHRFSGISGEDGLFAATPRPLWFVSERGVPTVVSHKSRHVSPAGGRPVPVSGFCTQMPSVFQNASNGFITIHERIGRVGSQRLTLYNGLWDVFAPHGLIPGGGMSIQKVPLGVTVRHIEFIDDASISTTSRPVYALLVSHEFEGDQSYLVNDGLSPEERQRIKDEKEAAMVRKQVEADLGGFDIEQEWVEEIEREECFTIDQRLGLAPPMPTRRFELWIVDASAQFKVMDKYQLDEFEHATAMKVMFLTDVVEDSDEIPEVNLFIGVGTSEIDQDGEDLASKGRILLFQVKKSKKKSLNKGYKTTPLQLALKSEKEMALGPVTSLSSLKTEDKYRMVVGAGAEVTVEQWGGGKLTQVGFYHAHMQVQDIVIFKTFFLLSDAYDSLHFLVWRESDKSLTLLAKDYEPNHVFASGLISRGGAMAFVCHDDRQNLSFLQYAPTDAAARGGNKLVSRADFHIGTQTTSLRSHWSQSSLMFNSCTTNSTLAALKQQDSMFGRLDDDQRFAINFGTSDGSFCSIVPLSEPTYWRLTALQSVMSNALESNCALSHIAWRLYRRSTRRAGCRNNDRMKGVIDGDVVMKFVDLPLPDQEDLASSIGSTVGLVMDNLLEISCASSVV